MEPFDCWECCQVTTDWITVPFEYGDIHFCRECYQDINGKEREDPCPDLSVLPSTTITS
jgi:hypothetical protein